MLRLTLAALGALTISLAYPAPAEDAMKADPMKAAPMATTCDDASMMKLKAEVEATTDAMMKEGAMKGNDHGERRHEGQRLATCAMHMDAAMKAAKGIKAYRRRARPGCASRLMF